MKMQIRKIRIPCINRVIIFGDGQLLFDFTKECWRRGMDVYVFAAPRHLEGRVKLANRGSLTLRDALEKEKIRFFCADNINNSKILGSLVTDRTLGIGLGETYTFNKRTVQLFKGRLFDFMIIDLPLYRGGAHFTWQILRGDRSGCWNIEIINEKMVPGVYDSGEIILSRRYAIPSAARRPADYFQIANKEGLTLFSYFLDRIKAGSEFKVWKVQEDRSAYYPRLFTPKHAFINWEWCVEEITRFICAFDDPFIGASTFLRKRKIFLKNCRPLYAEGGHHPFMSGLIYRIYNNNVFIAVKDGTIVVKRVLDDKGNNVISSLGVGSRFFTPHRFLEEAKQFEAFYDSRGLISRKR